MSVEGIIEQIENQAKTGLDILVHVDKANRMALGSPEEYPKIKRIRKENMIYVPMYKKVDDQ
jgi:hypothetical protein